MNGCCNQLAKSFRHIKIKGGKREKNNSRSTFYCYILFKFILGCCAFWLSFDGVIYAVFVRTGN